MKKSQCTTQISQIYWISVYVAGKKLLIESIRWSWNNKRNISKFDFVNYSSLILNFDALKCFQQLQILCSVNELVYSWRCRWTHLSAISISLLFKDGVPVFQCWSFCACDGKPCSNCFVFDTIRNASSCFFEGSMPADVKNSLDPSSALAPRWSSLCTLENWTSVSLAVQEDAPIDCFIKALLISVPIAFCLLSGTGKNKLLTFWFRSIADQPWLKVISAMVDLLDVWRFTKNVCVGSQVLQKNIFDRFDKRVET